MADAQQAVRHLRLLSRVESVVGRAWDLGGLRQEVVAADLDGEDQLDLLGRIDTYLGDMEEEADPLDERPSDADPALDAEDALLDLEDGFAPVALPDAPVP